MIRRHRYRQDTHTHTHMHSPKCMHLDIGLEDLRGVRGEKVLLVCFEVRNARHKPLPQPKQIVHAGVGRHCGGEKRRGEERKDGRKGNGQRWRA